MGKLFLSLGLGAVLLLAGCSSDAEESKTDSKNASAATEKDGQAESAQTELKLGEEITHEDDFFNYTLNIADFTLEKEVSKFTDGDKFEKDNYAIYSTTIKLTNNGEEPSNFMTLKYGIVPIDEKGEAIEIDDKAQPVKLVKEADEIKFSTTIKQNESIEGKYYFALPKDAKITEIVYYTSTVLKEQKAYFTYKIK